MQKETPRPLEPWQMMVSLSIAATDVVAPMSKYDHIHKFRLRFWPKGRQLELAADAHANSSWRKRPKMNAELSDPFFRPVIRAHRNWMAINHRLHLLLTYHVAARQHIIKPINSLVEDAIDVAFEALVSGSDVPELPGSDVLELLEHPLMVDSRRTPEWRRKWAVLQIRENLRHAHLASATMLLLAAHKLMRYAYRLLDEQTPKQSGQSTVPDDALSRCRQYLDQIDARDRIKRKKTALLIGGNYQENLHALRVILGPATRGRPRRKSDGRDHITRPDIEAQ